MYTAKTRSSNKRKTVLIAALAACLILAVGGGVLAWFSATNGVSNTFTNGNGNIKPPTTDPTGPDGGGEEGGGGSKTDGNFIEETLWIPDSPITPDAKVDKNPNIGIAPGSSSCYVFAEVENTLDAKDSGNHSYFILGKNWAPVSADVAMQYKDPNGNFVDRAYTGGLFVYVGADGSMEQLVANPLGQAAKDKYTGLLFADIITDHEFKFATGGKVNVRTWLAAGTPGADAGSGEDITTPEKQAEIIAAAKQWAKNNDSDPIPPTGTTTK